MNLSLNRLRRGERIASVSAILLFALMFLHWFSFEVSDPFNGGGLLDLLSRPRLAGSAWATLDYIPFVLVATMSVALVVSALRLTPDAQLPNRAGAMVGMLGVTSALLILYRIVDPPSFETENALTYGGTTLLPVYLALMATAGIALGGFLALREESHRLNTLSH
jgi:hypothetical protein